MARQRVIHSDGEKDVGLLLKHAEIISAEAQGISIVSEWAEYFQKKYEMPLQDIIELSKDWKKFITIPITAFSKDIGGLEAVSLFLHDMHKLSFAKIADMLSRDPRTIWTAYSKAKTKVPFLPQPESTRIHIPLKELANRKHTILETTCHILKEHYHLPNYQIAKLLGRSSSFVWITLKRYEEKK